MKMVIFREISRLVPIFLVVLAVAIGARFVVSNGIEQTAQNSAEIATSDWAHKIAETIPNIENVLTGEQVITAQTMIEMGHLQSKEILEYRVFDKDGTLRIKSISPETQFENSIAIGEKTNQFLNISLDMKPLHERIKIDSTQEDIYGSKIIVPLVKNEELIGYVEVINKESAIFGKFRNQFSETTFRFIILMLAAFLLPAILYLRRTAQLEQTSKRLRYSAEYDDLTNALNRGAFTKQITKDLEIASERGYSIAVHFIDLDRFKEINDNKGHEIGDEILRLTAKRLQKLLGPRDKFARLGGDEFVIYQPYLVGSSSKTTKLANDIIEVMKKPFFIKNNNIQIGASVGSSHFPRDGKQVDELLRTADLALYRAKEMGRSVAIEFDVSMETERQSRQAIEQLLRLALENELFYLNFQPFYDIKTNSLQGFEALLRINDKDGKPISPEIFIPIAEEIGLIGDIGEWVLREACKTAIDWPKNMVIAVNLSSEQFQIHNMPELVQEVLNSTGLSPSQLELEVTEGLLITDSDKVLKDLNSIKQLGVAIALDDFGTGYSSLSYLWQFPFDKLKVDKSFISTLGVADSKSHEILSTIVALGKVLDMKVTAEGVETEQQAELLRSFNCDLVQGYLFSRPLNIVDVAAELIKSVDCKVTKEKIILQQKSA